MSIIESITLFGIMAALAAIPSASVALVVTHSVILGIANGLAVSVGIVAGDLVFIILVILGLTFIAETLGGLFIVVKILTALYLLYLGFSLLKTNNSPKITVDNRDKNSLAASFLAGFLLTLGDIKAIIFYASLLPVFIDLSAVKTPEILSVILITIFSVGSIKIIYAVFAIKVAAYAQNMKIENTIRKIAGALMLVTGSYLIIKA